MDNTFFGFQFKVHWSLKKVRKRKMERNVNSYKDDMKYTDLTLKLANTDIIPLKLILS